MKRQKQILMVVVGLALAGAFAIFILDVNLLSAKGQAAVALTIVYEDGTEEVIDPEEDWTSYFSPLAIKTTTGTPITGVKYKVQVKPVFTGEVTSVSYANCKIYVAVDMSTKTTVASSAFSGSLSSSTWNTVASGTISASQLGTWAGDDGKHMLNVSPQLSISLTFEAGNTITRSASCSAAWSYLKEPATSSTPDGTYTSLSVQVAHTPLT